MYEIGIEVPFDIWYCTYGYMRYSRIVTAQEIRPYSYGTGYSISGWRFQTVADAFGWM